MNSGPPSSTTADGLPMQKKTGNLLRYPGLKARGVPYTAEHLARLEKKGLFPRRLKLSHRCVAWIEDEINDWVAALAAARGAEGS